MHLKNTCTKACKKDMFFKKKLCVFCILNAFFFSNALKNSMCNSMLSGKCVDPQVMSLIIGIIISPFSFMIGDVNAYWPSLP